MVRKQVILAVIVFLIAVALVQGVAALNNNDVSSVWQFNNASPENETYVVDSGRSGYHMNVTNPNTHSPGKFGLAYNFSGQTYMNLTPNQFLFLNMTPSDDPSGRFDGTISLWFKTNGSTTHQTLFTQGTGGRSGFQISVTLENITFSARKTSPSEWHSIESASPFSNNTWYHVCAVWTSAINRTDLYINGTSQGNATITGLAGFPLEEALGRTLVQGDPPQELSYFNGLLDEVVLFNKSLSAAECSQLASGATYPFSENPTINSHTLLPSVAYSYSQLNCTANVTDSDNLDEIQVNFTFFNGTSFYGNQFNASLNNVTRNSIVSASLPANLTRVTQNWTCQITVTDTNTGYAAASNRSVIIGTTLNLNNYNETPKTPALMDLVKLTANITYSVFSPIVEFILKNPLGEIKINTSTSTPTAGDNYTSDPYQLITKGKYTANVTGNNTYDSVSAQWQFCVNCYSIIINSIWPNRTMQMFTNVTAMANVTSETDLNVSTVNFTIYGPSNITFQSRNGTRNSSYHDYWNSTSFGINQSGTWRIVVNATGNQSNNMSSEYVVQVTDSVNTIPAAYTQSLDPKGANYTYDFGIYDDTDAKLNYTISFNCFNTQHFNCSVNKETLFLNESDSLTNPYKVTFYINNSNASVPDGNYTGNITFNRTIDHTIYRVPLLMTVNPPAGVIQLLNATNSSCDNSLANCNQSFSRYSDETFVQEWKVNNSGGYALSDCTPSLTGSSYAGQAFYSFNPSNFGVAQNASAGLALTFTNVPTGIYQGQLELVCRATSLGYNTSLSSNASQIPTILVLTSTRPTRTSGMSGGGPAGEVPAPEPKPLNLTALAINYSIQVCNNDAQCLPPENYWTCRLAKTNDCPMGKIPLKEWTCVFNAKKFESEAGYPCWVKTAWAVSLFALLFILGVLISIIVIAAQKEKRRG